MFIFVFGGVMIYLYTCSPTSSNLSKSQVPRHDLVAALQETANRPPKTSKESLPRQRTSANPPADTVDGRSPAPPRMYKTLQIMKSNTFELVHHDYFLPSYHLNLLDKKPSDEAASLVFSSTSKPILKINLSLVSS